MPSQWEFSFSNWKWRPGRNKFILALWLSRVEFDKGCEILWWYFIICVDIKNILHVNIMFFLLLVAGNLESGEPYSRKNFMPCKLLWQCSKGNLKKQWHHHYKIIYTPIQILFIIQSFAVCATHNTLLFFENMYLTENHQEHVDIIQNYKYRRNALLCPFISLAQWIGCNQFLYQKMPPQALRRAFLAWFWTL